MRIHILGIGGTFMSGVALLAKEAGHQVTGADLALYPPMNQQLQKAGIDYIEGYEENSVNAGADWIVMGNVMKRGQPATEYVLRHKLKYCSGPEWLAKYILPNKIVLAVSGTHGKTTTSSLLAWILEYAGYQPGFLIGGIPENFGVSARLGAGKYFVIEADEYDSAFFDKRSKFVHYHPDILILNNLEFDHADIFPNLEAIKQQFHYLIRTIPDNGTIIFNADDDHLSDVLNKGCYSSSVSFGLHSGEWFAECHAKDGSIFSVYYKQQCMGKVEWNLLGSHNVMNALAVLAACEKIGIPIQAAIAALSYFKNVKRRLEMKAQLNGITIYDDFAHHPTAIKTTLAGLKAKLANDPSAKRLIAVLEFGSHTMRMGVHKDKIMASLTDANNVICLLPKDDPWQLADLLKSFPQPAKGFSEVASLFTHLLEIMQPGDHIVLMSNSGFGGLPQKLITALKTFTVAV